MRCILHKWTKWSDPYQVKFTAMGKWSYANFMQKKVCERCNKVKERHAD